MSAFVINSYAFGGEDPDAKAYLNEVEVKDGQALEAGVRKAVDDFVKGCKTDGVWSPLKAACILMGARTIDGALVNLPTATTIATNNNFVAADYNRETGLKGNGSTKYILSGRNCNTDPQNDFHCSVYAHTAETGVTYIGAGGGVTGATGLFAIGSTIRFRNRNGTGDDVAGDNVAGFIGTSRSASGSYSGRADATNNTFTRTSQTPFSSEFGVFANNSGGSFSFYGNGRYQFYSIGTDVDMSLLAARLDTLEADIDSAI